MNRVGRRSRLLVGSALALSAILGTSGIALADTETGQHGHYSMRDADGGYPPVTCIYNQNGGVYTLKTVSVKSPQLWWSDTNSSVNNEHGKVAYRTWLLVDADGADGPWTKIRKSPLHYGTAYEDQPAYDANDQATLENHVWSFNAANYSANPLATIKVRVKAIWYRPNGTVLGTVTHDMTYYRPKYGTFLGLSVNWCQIKVIE